MIDFSAGSLYGITPTQEEFIGLDASEFDIKMKLIAKDYDMYIGVSMTHRSYSLKEALEMFGVF